MKYLAVLFDLDGTLYDNDAVMETAALAMLHQLLSPQELLQSVGAVVEHYRAGDSLDKDGIATVISRFAPDLDPNLLNECVGLCYQQLSRYIITPDAEVVLSTLEARKIPYGIVTNSEAVQQVKTELMGLERRAGCVLVSGVFGADKPDPSIFLEAARRLGVDPAQTLMVGDCPYSDITGAHAAGMHAAFINSTWEWPDELISSPPEYMLDRLTDLLAILG